MTQSNAEIRTEVLIAGGGMVGLTTAIGLARHGIDVVVADAQDPSSVVDAGFDGRASAVAFASYRLLDGIGIWPELAEHAQPIDEIRVSDGPSLMHLHFDHAQLGEGPLGFMLENRRIRQGLFRAAEKLENLRFIAPDPITSVDREVHGARAQLASGRRIRADVVLGAEGRRSPLRQAAGIKVTSWGYDQSAVVATIDHEHPHCGIAHERFLPAGPFAILPLRGNRSSLVWTVKTSTAPAIMALGERGFAAEVNKRVGGFLGEVRPVGPRWTYPLSLMLADRYTDRRLALVGDAAHGIHPIAGQGLNMGFRDIAVLVEVLVEAARAGQDLGSDVVLEGYEAWRRVDNTTLGVVTDLLNRLFSNDNTLIRTARDVGLAAVNRMPPLKGFFMQHARGTFGRLPRLLEGRPL